jgi:hypothetical protein|tara:strand:+ start:1104 stop:1775 length:672 start_codon:yes stop_codon:yes gene_type:complete
MNITNDTLKVLKNFATINPNIVIKPGGQLKTISEAKNIMAVADGTDDFPTEFGIYDLNEFLSVSNLVQDPNFDFQDKNVKITSGGNTVTYFFSEPEILTSPSKEITMPDTEVGISITQEVLSQVRKAAAVLGHTEMSIKGSGGKVTLSVVDSSDATANSFDIELNDNNDCTEEFNFIVNINNLKLIEGDYFVNISSKLISQWTCSSMAVKYFIALEKASTFGV